MLSGLDGPVWASEQDTAQFVTAIQRLREYLDEGERLPLYYTLPTGRSIESVCDRLAHSADPIPGEVLPTLHFLADALSIQKPHARNYGTYAPLVKEIAARLALSFDQRALGHRKSGACLDGWSPKNFMNKSEKKEFQRRSGPCSASNHRPTNCLLRRD
jgi:hypothetical protein